jgi:hypothetical protein
VRFPTRSEVAEAAPRVVRAVTTAVRQAPSLASYAVQLSAEAAGGLRERARQRLGGERPKPQGPSEAALRAGAPGAARPFADRVAQRAAERRTAESAPAEGAPADGAAAQGAVAEGAVAEGAVADSAAPEGAVADSAAPEGAVADSAAPEGAVADTTAAADAAATQEEPHRQLQPDELPISDWDHASMPSLRARVARLTLDELLRLRAYETEHAGRLAVLTMLDNRIAKMDPTRED